MTRTRPQYSDDNFLEGLRSGDHATLSALYKKYYHLVLKFIVNNNGTAESAQDIYQETIIILYENVRKPEFSLTCQLQTYVYSIARRLWLKQLKKNGNTFLFKEEEEIELAEVASDVEVYEEKEKDVQKMYASLEALGEPCATLIKDFYVLHKSMEEIAEKFGYTNADSAKNQKYKCLQRLKKYFFDSNKLESQQMD